MSTHDHHKHGQCVTRYNPYAQNLDEMDFTRGIWFAAINGEAKEVQKYLDKKTSPDALDSSGYTALHYAARHGHINVCRILLRSGANPDSLTRSGKSTPLHRAAYSGHSDIVKILAEHGAKLDLSDIDGQTALHKAAQKAHAEVVQFLMKNNPNLSSIKDKWNKVPIDYVTTTNTQIQILLKPRVL